jgi:hypothetical protein
MSGIICQPIDPLEKVFEDVSPQLARVAPVTIAGARNEWVSGQLMLRSAEANLMAARLHATPLQPATAAQGPTLPPPELRFVGYVPVRNNTRGTPQEHLVRQAPANYPDPLLDDQWLHLRKQRTQPVWITMHIPADTPPGHYRGSVSVTTRSNHTAAVDVDLEVHPARLPETRRLHVTNWFSLSNICSSHGVPLFSEGFWQVLRRYACIMGEHRQDTVITPLFQLIQPALDPSGGITLDFTLFDRWVALFGEYGVAQIIEGGHLGGRKGGWNEGFAITTWQERDGAVQAIRADAGSPEADAFLAWFLPALRRHLEARGWADRYVQHLADEPVDANASSYNDLLRAVRRHWPELRLIDANMCQSVEPLDIWVPILNVWHRAHDFYRQQQQQGREIWFYTCLGPTGTYANRLIDYPLLKVRLLHWLNAHFGATGYLHWGLNYWDGVASPFSDVEPAHTPELVLPPGDCGIVYPGPGGPLSSIRFEAMRDGIADYELIRELAESNPTAAREITTAVIRDFDSYDLDVAHFRAVRRRLLDEVARVQGTK